MPEFLEFCGDLGRAIRGGFATQPGAWISLMVLGLLAGMVWGLLAAATSLLHACGLRWRPLQWTLRFVALHLLAATVALLAVWAGFTAWLAWTDSPHRSWLGGGAWGMAAWIIALAAELLWVTAALLALHKAGQIVGQAYRRAERA